MRWPPSNRKDAAHIEIPSECLEGDTRTVSLLESAQCEQPASLQVGPTRSLCRQWADAAGMTVQRSADVPRNWRSHRVRRRFRPLPQFVVGACHWAVRLRDASQSPAKAYG
jgi:hypothetical protein